MDAVSTATEDRPQHVMERARLPGHPYDEPRPQPKVGGWHWTEWLCELVGTAFQLFLGFSVVAVMEAPGAPGRESIPSPGVRLVLIGIAFGLLAAIVAVSPFGRRSGAHLNPAVTLGFFARGHTHPHDLVGYALAQVAGALGATAGFAAVWGGWARGVSDARTAPSDALSPWVAAGIEAGLTLVLLFVVFSMVSSPRTARWTPAVVTGVLSGLIWAGAPWTGASMNPARTLGPDVVAGGYGGLWIYFLGPPVGALLAAGLFTAVGRGRTTLTAKLFHDGDYPSTQRTDLPAKPHRGSGQTAGRADGAALSWSASRPRPAASSR
jgi:aquaporin Z